MESQFLSTPSARRATSLGGPCGPGCSPISIHALREEGDQTISGQIEAAEQFLSTPSARRATINFRCLILTIGQFLSTPSARRATSFRVRALPAAAISIHALREEGDILTPRSKAPHNNFYPRPPRGGRHCVAAKNTANIVFLSTPSARRATPPSGSTGRQHCDFYPRPPRGGRRGYKMDKPAPEPISIHALREEGD